MIERKRRLCDNRKEEKRKGETSANNVEKCKTSDQGIRKGGRERHRI